MQKELVSCRLRDAQNGFGQYVLDRIDYLRNAIKNTLEQLQSLKTLQTMAFSWNWDAFLKILIMAIKNSSLSHQHNKKKSIPVGSAEEPASSVEGLFTCTSTEKLSLFKLFIRFFVLHKYKIMYYTVQ